MQNIFHIDPQASHLPRRPLSSPVIFQLVILVFFVFLSFISHRRYFSSLSIIFSGQSPLTFLHCPTGPSIRVSQSGKALPWYEDDE